MKDVLKISIVDIQNNQLATNKTMAGGFGTSSAYSKTNNVILNTLQKIKSKSVRIPLLEFGYLAHIFESQGHSVDIVYSAQVDTKSDVFLIYTSLVEFKNEMACIKHIRDNNPTAKVGLIGLLPTVLSEELLILADFVIKGEPDTFFYLNPINKLKLDGVLKGDILQDIDELPFPKWNKFNMKQFVHKPFFSNKTVYPVLSSRGCPFSCKYYCAYPIFAGAKVRYRDVDKLIEELDYLRNTYNAQAILFRDPTFTLNKKRIEELCDKMIEKKYNYLWACETHPTCLTTQLIDKMKAAGCVAITIGVESRTEDVLVKSHRFDTKEEKLIEMINYCEKNNVKIMAGYIFGNLNDTISSIKNTINYAKLINTSYAQFTISTPYPGTEYYKDIKDTITTFDWENYDTYTLVFKHKFLTVTDIETLKNKAYSTYYLRPKWLFKRYLKNKVYDLLNRR